MKKIINPKDFFYVLADETRLRCVLLMQTRGEICVCEFTAALKIIQPKISRHLAIIKKFNLVEDRRDGIWVYYKINSKLPKWIQNVLSDMAKNITRARPYDTDLIMFDSLGVRSRSGPKCCN